MPGQFLGHAWAGSREASSAAWADSGIALGCARARPGVQLAPHPRVRARPARAPAARRASPARCAPPRASRAVCARREREIAQPTTKKREDERRAADETRAERDLAGRVAPDCIFYEGLFTLCEPPMLRPLLLRRLPAALAHRRAASTALPLASPSSPPSSPPSLSREPPVACHSTEAKRSGGGSGLCLPTDPPRQSENALGRCCGHGSCAKEECVQVQIRVRATPRRPRRRHMRGGLRGGLRHQCRRLGQWWVARRRRGAAHDSTSTTAFDAQRRPRARVVLQDHAPWAELYPRRLGFAERERAYGASAVVRRA